MTAQLIIAFAFGVIFIVALLTLAIRFPRPTVFQYNVFRIVLALAAAGAATMIPGFINLEFSATVGLILRAGGALAVFVIVFFFNPAQLAIQSRSSSGDDDEGVDNPLLSPIWDRLDEDLQDAFAIAANKARRDGQNRVSTQLLFSCLRRLNPAVLSSIFQQLPSDALPDPIPRDVPADKQAIDKSLASSDCVQESVTLLSSQLGTSQKLSSADVFVDIAKHGHGRSVTRLRTHGVDAERIDAIVNRLEGLVIERSKGGVWRSRTDE